MKFWEKTRVATSRAMAVQASFNRCICRVLVVKDVFALFHGESNGGVGQVGYFWKTLTFGKRFGHRADGMKILV